MKMRTEYTCPLELVHDMIKGKWKPIILWRLRLGATSLAKLGRDIDGITQKMLSEQLKELMDYGFVEKKSYEGYPLRVEYFLTDGMGMEILEALRIMQHIGIDYLKANDIADFKSDFCRLRYVEMEVQHFRLFEHIQQFNVLVAFYFLPLYHKAYRNRVPQFCCNFSCLHNVFHLSYFDILYWLLTLLVAAYTFWWKDKAFFKEKFLTYINKFLTALL